MGKSMRYEAARETICFLGIDPCWDEGFFGADEGVESCFVCGILIS